MLTALKREAHYQYRCLRLVRSFLKQSLMHCNLQVTYRCNFRCQICDFWKEPHDPGDELSLADIRTIGQKLNELGTFIISLAGGEPLIRADLFDVITALNATNHFPILITNGWFVNETVARDILRAGLQEISVSIDYRDPAKHDAQRDHPGAWQRAVRALELLHRARTDRRNRVHMISVLMDDNLDEIEGLLQLCRDLGVTYMISLYSGSRGTRRVCRPNTRVSARLLDLKARYPEFVSLTSYLERFDEAIAAGGIGDCQTGRVLMNIDHRGDVARCVDTVERPIGNILRDDARTIAHRLQELRDTQPCAKCWTSCRGLAESMLRPPRTRQFREFYTSVKRYG